jgi:nitrite reductase/ring-hydroxylating ferredoxin subunit
MLRRKTTPDAEGFYAVGTADSVLVGEITAVNINNHKLILTRWQDELVAFSSICPHAAADLTKGDLYNGRITCPDHDYKFDIRTGKTLWPPDEVCRLRRYPVKEENGTIKVRLT